MKLYPKDRRALLEAAMGRRPCDLAVENVRFVNVFTGEIYPAVVYVLDGFVAYVEEGGRADPALAHQVVDGQGAYLTPGFVDPHIHIESTMLTPRAFAAAVVPHGTTTVVTDPHEIANVLGEQAVVYMHDAAEDLPMRQLVDIPSCVPAVPGLENSGAEFDAGTVHRLAKLPRVTGLAEVMDFLAVAQGEQRMLDMLDAAQQEGLYVQGHVPVSDKRLLSAYAIGGPTTCHETREGEDAVSKLRLGLRIDARESSIAKDVEKIYSQVRRLRYLDRVSLCTDDREAHDILENGHMDNALRKAVACGMDGVDALRCATLHPALESGLSNLGAVAPGYAADFLLLEDLKDFRVRAVYYGGRLVARDGVLTQEITPKTFALEQMDTMRVPPLKREDFDIAAPVEQGVVKVNVLHFAELEKSNTTRCVEEIPVRDGKLDLSQQPDLCYVKIVNRHGKGTVCRRRDARLWPERGGLCLHRVARQPQPVRCLPRCRQRIRGLPGACRLPGRHVLCDARAADRDAAPAGGGPDVDPALRGAGTAGGRDEAGAAPRRHAPEQPPGAHRHHGAARHPRGKVYRPWAGRRLRQKGAAALSRGLGPLWQKGRKGPPPKASPLFWPPVQQAKAGAREQEPPCSRAPALGPFLSEKQRGAPFRRKTALYAMRCPLKKALLPAPAPDAECASSR